MRICHRESKKGNSKRKRNLSYSKITDAESLAYTHSPIGSGGTDWKLLFLGTSNHLEGLSEGEASARGGVRKEERKWRVTIVRLGRGRYDE